MDGRHRSLRAVRARPLLVTAVAAVLAVALAAWVGYSYGTNHSREPNCSTPLSINIAAAPEISPVLAHIAGGLTAEQRTAGHTCFLVQVSGLEPAQVAAGLTGSGKEQNADVWVPDSTYWLREVATINLDVPEQGQSLASSPTVLAMPEQVAKRFGWPSRRVGWDVVLAAAGSATPVQLGIGDPANSPLGLFGLLAVRDTVHGGNRPDTARVAAFRELSKHVSAPSENLLDTLRRGSAAPDAVGAAPVSEQAVVQYSRIRQPVPVVAAYPDGAVPGLDYPYVVLPGASDAVRDAAQKFLGVVLAADPSELAARGFRAPDGTDRSGRLLAVIDISGSMNDEVPGTGKTRIELTKQTAQAGLGLFRPTTELGLWVFSTDLGGGKDYRELLPIQPMYAARERAYQVIGQIQAKQNGATGLYDTVLAGYQKLRVGWNPGRINVLVVLTDGQNEDPNGISRGTLLTKLRALADPRKPLRIIFIGLGSGVNATDLSQIAAVTGGRAFVTPDPRRIGDIFLAALASMTCVPPDCARR